LSRQAFLRGVVLHVPNRPPNVSRRPQKNFPQAARPRLGQPAACLPKRSERMDSLGHQLPSRRTFQEVGDLFHGIPMSPDDQMRVLRQDGGCPNVQAASLHKACKSVANLASLPAAESDSGIFQEVLGRNARLAIVRFSSHGAACVGFCRPAEADQFSRADELRPRTARIVRQPETVGGEDDVKADDHVLRAPLRVAANHEKRQSRCASRLAASRRRARVFVPARRPAPHSRSAVSGNSPTSGRQ